MKTLEVMEKVLRAKRRRPMTEKNYRLAFRSLSEFSEEWPDSSGTIDVWLASLTQYSDTTVKLLFSIISASGKYMKRAYKLNNPCEDAERPRAKKKRRRYFSASEMVRIIKACKGDYELLLVMTLIDSACRIGELAGLKGGDVGENCINVVGKTGERRYRLNENLCRRLREFADDKDSPVFRHRNGGFFPDGNGLAERVRRIVVSAGLEGEKLGAHTIRHSSASLVARKTGQALIVKALLQHDDIDMSMKYIHDVDDLAIGNEENSPLRLLGEQYAKEASGGHNERLELTSGEGITGAEIVKAEGDGLIEVEGGSLVGDLFPEVKVGVAVRPILRFEDLSLIRDTFVFYAKYHDGNRVSMARALMRRMLRKGGSKFYSRE